MKNLSLGGCGFMGIYHVGVVKAIKERKPEYLHKIAGTSCGALVAAATVCDCPMGT
jgi:predicted acylesterase/phospholipase RssA